MEIKIIKNNQREIFIKNLEKAYTEGIYADTPANRKLGRVGMSYSQYAEKIKQGGDNQQQKESSQDNNKELKNSIKVDMNFEESASDMPISTKEGLNGTFTLNQFKGEGKYQALEAVSNFMKNTQSKINSLLGGDKRLIKDASQINFSLNRQDKDEEIDIEAEYGGGSEDIEKYSKKIEGIVDEGLSRLNKTLNKLERYSFDETDSNDEATAPLSEKEYRKIKNGDKEKQYNHNSLKENNSFKEDDKKEDIYESQNWKTLNKEELNDVIKTLNDANPEYPLNNRQLLNIFSKYRVAKFPNGSFIIEYYTPKHKDDMVGNKGKAVTNKDEIGGFNKVATYYTYDVNSSIPGKQQVYGGRSNAIKDIKKFTKESKQQQQNSGNKKNPFKEI